jgi:hypothetical protein
MSGGIQKYPPSGASTTPNYPTTIPPQPPTPRPAPPAPAPPPTGSIIVSGGGGIVNNLDNQINYSNQKVGYFKIDLYNTKPNLYGESTEKWYYPPIEVKCLLERGEFVNTDTEFGVDTTQTITVTVSKTEFETTYNFTPEVGDIITDQERYYEVSSINRSFVTLPGTGTSSSIVGTPGFIVLYVLSAYLTRTSKLNLIKYSV